MGSIEMDSPVLPEGKDDVLQPLSLEKLALNSDSESVSCTTEGEDSETMDSSSASDNVEDSEMLSDSQTPRESTFNPFAPGPEDIMVLAPNPKKDVAIITKVPLRRRLMFSTDSEEDSLLETISEMFLELIISSQAEEVYLMKEKDFSDTPNSVPLLTGVADTCPDAPVRLPVLKARKLDQTICRKLDFGSTLV